MDRTTTFFVAALASACGTNTDLTNRPLFDNGVNVFETNVIDGVTGATVEMATVSVQVGRHRLDTTVEEAGSGSDATGDGFFTIYGIPYGDFRVFATAPGYADFQALKSFTDASPSDSLAGGDPFVYYFNNIMMYPEGTVPEGITVSVFDGANGNPVAGATVVAALDSVGSPIPASNVLLPNVGLRPQTLSAETGTDGKVELAGDNLVIGGEYEIDVFGALDAQGVYLVPTNNQTVTVGEDVQEVLVFLSRPFLAPVALRVNNEDVGGFDSNLQVTFPYAIEICTPSTSHTWFNLVSNTFNNGVYATPASPNPVTAALSAGDTVLTLTYNLAPGTDDPTDDLRVQFSGVQVKPKGAAGTPNTGSCTQLNSVRLRNNNGSAFVSTIINVRDV